MNEIKMTSTPALTVSKALDMLSMCYCKTINSGLPVKGLPSTMLWGPSGVGKSQLVQQLKDEIAAKTGKSVTVTDVRLMLYNPIDLRGIPTSNEDKTLAIWLKPKIFDMNPSSETINILFLDEISAAPPSVQAAAYQITLDRTVGEHKLPDNCIVIAAGNRVTDKSVAYKMPKALANRLCHIEIQADFKSWRDWAVKSGINQKVIGFISFKRDSLMDFDAGKDDNAFPTPRSWEMVSNILNTVDDNIETVYSMISGLVGNGTAIEFKTWCGVYNQLPSVKDIFNGKNPPVPKTTDVLYALISTMFDYAKNHSSDLEKIANSIKYAMQLPSDFSVVLLKDYMSIEKNYKSKLMKIPEFMKWLETKGRLLNEAY
ncbi:MAG: AAA family ATPase [Clostridia bacterium]|nr:AAA family ATPase [Clostridia bacterium]